MRTARRVEWPTVAIALAIYLAFGLLTWFHDSLPLWLLFLAGGYVVALHGSLQHEVVHGHPTPWRWLNEALVLPSLWLWMPFGQYRANHLQHHDDQHLTDTALDPESFYVSPERWSRLPAPLKAFLWAQNSLLGRLTLGPLACAYLTIRGALRHAMKGEWRALAPWPAQLLGIALTLVWALWICAMPLWVYLLCFAYAGTSFTLLRSFLEHQARPDPKERIVAVEAGPVLSLMFLYNNLHILHHSEPGVAWFRLPARWRQRSAELLAANGGYRYAGYGEIALRYLLRPKEHPVHPGWQGIATLAAHGPLVVATGAPEETIQVEEAPVASPVAAAGEPASAG